MNLIYFLFRRMLLLVFHKKQLLFFRRMLPMNKNNDLSLYNAAKLQKNTKATKKTIKNISIAQ